MVNLLSGMLYDILKKEFNITSLTHMQKTAIERIKKGKNVLIIAPTGSGKTEAAVLPIFDTILKKKLENTYGVLVLYITPLRALNRDIFQRLIKIGDALGISVQIRHGDTSMYVRRRQTLHPPVFLITTPETFQILLVSPKFKEHLKTVQFIVIDELHDIAEEKRGTQLSVGIIRLEDLIGKSVQKIALSATISNPHEVIKLIVNNEPYEIVISNDERSFEISIDAVFSATDQLWQEGKEPIYYPLISGSVQKFIEYINKNTSVIIFTNTRVTAEVLSNLLLKAINNTTVHHSSLSKEVRIAAENEFKAGNLKSIVSTSSLELGIDIGHVDFVIQFMSPRTVSRLVQRIGRGSHRISGTAKGVVITPYFDEILESAIILQHALKNKIERLELYDLALDVLAHQICGLLLTKGKLTRKAIFNMVRKAYPYRNLSYELFESVVDFMITERQIAADDVFLKPIRKTREFYFENISTIPDTKQYDVYHLSTKKKIGVLDEEFVLKNIDVGTDFIMFGRAWRVINFEEEKIYVEESSDENAIVAKWVGENIPVPFEIAREANKLRINILEDFMNNKSLRYLIDNYYLTKDAYSLVVDVLKLLSKSYNHIHDNEILIEYERNNVIINAPFGTLVNNTLGLILSSLLSSQLGFLVSYVSDPYRIFLSSKYRIPLEQIEILLKQLSVDHLKQLLETLARNTPMFLWQFKKVAEKFGILARGAEISKGQLKYLIQVYRNTPVYSAALRELLHFKFDINRTKQVLKMIQTGEITLHISKSEGLSVLSKLSPLISSSLLKSPGIKPNDAIINIVRKRLLKRRITLTCMYCGEWAVRGSVSSLLESDLVCPVCGSKLLAVSKFKDKKKLRNIVKKYKEGKPLSKDERKLLNEGVFSANLVLTYGKRALLALSAHGIGAETAKRILKNTELSEKDLLSEIIKAERQYVKTRPFWDSS